MSLHALNPTREEIGDPFAAMRRARAIRKAMYAPRPVKMAPVEVPPPAPIAPVIVWKPRDILNIATPGFGTENRAATIRECLIYVSRAEGISMVLLTGAVRTGPLVLARHKAMWLCRNYSKRSLPEIGRKMGGRDHTTILHGVTKINRMIEAGKWTPPERWEVIRAAA